MRGPAGEWWCDGEKAPGFFTVTGRGYGVTRMDAGGGERRGRANDDEGGEEDGDVAGEEETETIEDVFAIDRSGATDEDDESDARRWRLGAPCLDPRTVIALDLAFARDEVGAGEVEPRPASLVCSDDDSDELELSALWGTAPVRGGWSEGSEWSEAGSEEREAYVLAESPEGRLALERTP